MIKIKIHSLTDLITNSSTTIFTNSENSVEPCKDMINEILKLMGETRTCDELFDISITKDADYICDIITDQLDEYASEEELAQYNLPEDYYDRREAAEVLVKDILNGKIEKPDWFDRIQEDYENDCDTDLVIVAKDPKFESLAQKMLDFLYSTESYEGAN